MPFKDIRKSKQYRKDHYLENKEKYKATHKKNTKAKREWFRTQILDKCFCLHCGEDNPITLDFHHLDKSTKERSVSQMVQDNLSKERILNEAAKCIVLCSNCHRIEEHRLRNLGK